MIGFTVLLWFTGNHWTEIRSMYVPPFIEPYSIRMFSSQVGNFANVTYALFDGALGLTQNDVYLLAGNFSYQGNVTSSRVNNDGLVIVSPRVNNTIPVYPLYAGGLQSSGNIRFSFPMSARVQPILYLCSQWQVQTNAPLLSGDASAVINIHLWYGRVRRDFDTKLLQYDADSNPTLRSVDTSSRADRRGKN
jgi:hypothetical protein